MWGHQSTTGLISQRPLGCCSFQNILTNPIISQINTSLLPYFISYYSSAFTTRTPKCTLRSVLSVLNMMSFFILLAPSVFFSHVHHQLEAWFLEAGKGGSTNSGHFTILFCFVCSCFSSLWDWLKRRRCTCEFGHLFGLLLLETGFTCRWKHPEYGELF